MFDSTVGVIIGFLLQYQAFLKFFWTMAIAREFYETVRIKLIEFEGEESSSIPRPSIVSKSKISKDRKTILICYLVPLIPVLASIPLYFTMNHLHYETLFAYTLVSCIVFILALGYTFYINRKRSNLLKMHTSYKTKGFNGVRVYPIILLICWLPMVVTLLAITSICGQTDVGETTNRFVIPWLIFITISIRSQGFFNAIAFRNNCNDDRTIRKIGDKERLIETSYGMESSYVMERN
jgi:hypothetical protein